VEGSERENLESNEFVTFPILKIRRVVEVSLMLTFHHFFFGSLLFLVLEM
jgi:hypothetical protein